MRNRTRGEKRKITTVQDPVHGTQTSTWAIVNVFSSFLRQKYGPIRVDDDCVRRMTEAGLPRLPYEWKEALDRHITSEELIGAMNKGGGNKAPGRECI
jgi:hypothetical protein